MKKFHYFLIIILSNFILLCSAKCNVYFENAAAGTLSNTSSQAGKSVGVYVILKAYLQGAYLPDGTMRTSLNTFGTIPLNQPYNIAPFNYNGTESVVGIPPGVVDWVYLEARITPTSIAAEGKRAAFIKSDGFIVELDGRSPVKMVNLATGNYYMVVGHRNHLPIMSSATILLSPTSTLYDYTTDLNQYFGGDAASLSGERYGMYAGDANKSFIISATDYSIVTNNLLQSNYNAADLNMTGVVSASDYQLITNNLLKISNVPLYP